MAEPAGESADWAFTRNLARVGGDGQRASRTSSCRERSLHPYHPGLPELPQVALRGLPPPLKHLIYIRGGPAQRGAHVCEPQALCHHLLTEALNQPAVGDDSIALADVIGGLSWEGSWGRRGRGRGRRRVKVGVGVDAKAEGESTAAGAKSGGSGHEEDEALFVGLMVVDAARRLDDDGCPWA